MSDRDRKRIEAFERDWYRREQRQRDRRAAFEVVVAVIAATLFGAAMLIVLGVI